MLIQKVRRKTIPRNKCMSCGRFCGTSVRQCIQCLLRARNKKGHGIRSGYARKACQGDGKRVEAKCHICCRISTHCYPLVFINTEKCIRTSSYFSWVGRKRQSWKLCGDCYSYFILKKGGWRYAWPAVLYSVLLYNGTPSRIRQIMRDIIPVELLWSWVDLHQLVSMKRNDRTNITDFTHMFECHPLPNNFMKVDEFVDASVKYTMPKILCPLGCHICLLNGGVGYLSFAHMINYYYAKFKLFHADGRLLRGVAPGWLNGMPSVGLFGSGKVVPGCEVHQTRGLVIITCEGHQRGSYRQVVHMVTNPLSNVTASVMADNTTLATVKPRVLKLGRGGFLCSTWGLYAAHQSSCGISTFSLTDDRRWNYVSDMAAKVSKLVIDHRPDVLQYLYHRVMMDTLPASVVRDLIDTHTTVSDNAVQKALLRGSFICPLDAINMRERDRKLRQHDDCPSYAYVHPLTSYGARPLTPPVWKLRYPSNSEYDSVTMLIWVILTFASVSDIFTRCMTDTTRVIDRRLFWNMTCVKYLQKILNSFLTNDLPRERQLTRSLCRLRRSIIRSLDVIDSDEVRRRGISVPLHHVADMFCLMCLDMQVGVGIIDDNGVLTVFNDDGGRIVLLVTFNRRNRNRMSSRSLAVLNEEPRNLQVVAVVSAKSVYKLPYAYFRHGGQWQGWWFAKPYEHPHECSISLDDISDSILQYDICLFTVIPDVPSNEYNRSLMEVVGGQNVVYCAEHRVLLVKEEFPAKCCCTYCARGVSRLIHKAFVSCPFRASCRVAVCRKVFLSLIENSDGSVTYVSCNNHTINDDTISFLNCDRRTSELDPCAALQTKGSVEGSPGDAFSSDNDGVLSGGISFGGDPDINSDPSVEERRAAFATNVGNETFQVEDINVSGAFLFNHICGVLHRKGYPSHLPRYAQRYFQSIIASSKSSIGLPLLYPESLLFTSVFWKMLIGPVAEGAVPGALPISLYSTKANYGSGICSFRDHCIIRLQDWSSSVISDARYILFMFDICLNEMLNHTTTNLVMKRGWEHISGDNTEVRFADREHYVAFDSADSRRNVRQLAAMISEECPRYFVTITANQHGTPCVSTITEQRHKFAESDDSVSDSMLVESSCVPYVVVWYNFLCSFIEYLFHGGDTDLFGNITAYWMRFEWQSAESSLPHCHLLLWSHEPIDMSTKRIVCSLRQFQSFKESIFLKRLVKTEAEWEDVCGAFLMFQRHSCEKSKGRCQKRGDDGQLHCKVPFYEPSTSTRYVEISENLSDEELFIYLKLGWAVLDPLGGYKIKPRWQPGRWLYATDGLYQWCPVNPYLFCIFRSSCNVQLVDYTMAARYLSSYAAGVEEHLRTSLYATGASTVGAVIEPLEHVKMKKDTAGKQQCKASSRRSKKVVPGRIVSLPEAIFYIMRFRYVSTSASFLHIRTAPVDERPVVKKSRKTLTAVEAAHGSTNVQLDVRDNLIDF